MTTNVRGGGKLTAEKSDKKGNGLQIFLVVLVLVSMVLNVYLFRYYAEQDDGVEVMTTWADANREIHQELTSITKTLADLETRQGAQDESVQSVIETLTLVEARQAEEAARPAVEPNWLDKDSWADANEKMQDSLASITKTLADLEARQGAQDESIQSVIETLTLVETRQAEEAATPAVEPNWLDRDSWADANEKMQDTLVSITKTLADLEARQGAQDKSLQSVIETLTLVETRQAEEAATPAVEPNWLDRDSWADANEKMQDTLVSITKTLADLEARQGAQDKSLQSVIETLTLVETRQAEEGATPAAEPNWIDRESWATANQQIGEELSTIKVMLDEIKVEVQEAKEAVERNEDAQVQGSASLLELETETDRTIQVMAPLAEATYQENLIEAEEHTCPIVEVRLLPGDSVWGIVARFRPSPRPTLVNAVVEYNEITDPRRLPVGFPVKVPMDLVNGK